MSSQVSDTRALAVLLTVSATVLLYARTQNALVGICAGLATYLVAVNVVV